MPINGYEVKTVGDLRRMLAGLPDDSPVLGGLDGLTEDLPDELTCGRLLLTPTPGDVWLRVELIPCLLCSRCDDTVHPDDLDDAGLCPACAEKDDSEEDEDDAG